MKAFLALSGLVLLAACATSGEQLAAVECKVYPITTASVAGRKPNVDSLDQRQAEMQLAASDYRMRNLRRNGYNMNIVEDALRDCNAR